MRYLGMDVHGKATVFCLLDADGKTVETGSVPTTAPALSDLAQRLSKLRLNVHFYTLVLDGVYVKSDNEELRFLRLLRPSEADGHEVAMQTAKNVQANLEKKGRTSGSESNGDGAYGADGGRDSSRFGASGAIGAWAAESREGSARTALASLVG